MSLLISSNPELLNINYVHSYLSQQSYWAGSRSKLRVTTSIENSIAYGVYYYTEQIGFARVVTDRAIFAWIMDFFIDDKFKGKGIGQQLLAEILKNEDLKLVQKWGLATKDAHGFYKKMGFEKSTKGEYFMERIVNLQDGN